MQHWYKEHVVWMDKELNLKLMRKALLTSIYAPQVIVQGLQEAGIFSDALHMGQTHLEKSQSQEVFMSSVSWPNSIQAAATGELTIVNEFQAAK